MNSLFSLDVLYTKKAWQTSLTINAVLLGLTLLGGIGIKTLIITLVAGLALGVLLGAGISREFGKPVLPFYYLQGVIAAASLLGGLLPYSVGGLLWSLGAILYLALMTALMMHTAESNED